MDFYYVLNYKNECKVCVTDMGFIYVKTIYKHKWSQTKPHMCKLCLFLIPKIRLSAGNVLPGAAHFRQEGSYQTLFAFVSADVFHVEAHAKTVGS